MIFEIHIPVSPLDKYIENIVYYSGYSAEHLVDKLLPDGGIHLLMDMANKPSKLYHDMTLESFLEFDKCFISGQHRSYILIEANVSSMMVTRFKPGGAYPFFNFPISHLNDKVVQLEPLVGGSVEMTRQQIMAEPDVSAKFRIIESYFLDCITNGVDENGSLTIALEELMNNPFKVTTKGLAEKAGISQKHLISLFEKKVGLTPKVLSRIFRFQQVIRKIEENGSIDWMDIALECGYYDQAHFIKDFSEFSGINPTKYPDLRGEYLNYLPVK